MDHDVVVGEGDDVSGGRGDSRVPGATEAGTWLQHVADAHVLHDAPGGAVAWGVVDDDELVRSPVEREQALQAAAQLLGAVARAHHDRGRGRADGRRRRLVHHGVQRGGHIRREQVRQRNRSGRERRFIGQRRDESAVRIQQVADGGRHRGGREAGETRRGHGELPGLDLQRTEGPATPPQVPAMDDVARVRQRRQALPQVDMADGRRRRRGAGHVDDAWAAHPGLTSAAHAAPHGLSRSAVLPRRRDEGPFSAGSARIRRAGR